MDIITFLAALAVFLIILLLLVAVLLYAKNRLLPQGNVCLTVNDRREHDVEPGATLLSALAAQQLFLPSACGGGATCGLCKCRVVQGGGTILPTETGFFTRKQQHDRWRLACQVKVRDDMRIEIPDEILGVRKWACEVVSNRNVATYIKEFVVRLPEGETMNFRSGGYIQVDVPACTVDFRSFDIAPAFRDEWDARRMWDLTMRNPAPTFRAYSMANHPAEGNLVMLNVRIATPPWDRAKGAWAAVNPGICSSYLYARRPGDRVTLSGPYGEFFLRDTANEMLFVGGGAGMAPMRSHLFHLFRTLRTARRVTFWYGARSRREIFYEDEFRALEREFPNFQFTIALSEPRPEDEWSGPVGFIHTVLYDNYLKTHPAPEDIEYYLCGPPQMTAAVTALLDAQGVAPEMVLFDNFGS
jgi:Na+-transporting NADH:ubiquinone oxidoreductase subunit F